LEKFRTEETEMQVSSLFDMQSEMAYRQDRMRRSVRRQTRRRFRHVPPAASRSSGDARA
jgi:hypothetical protein